jgi:hypothetical protein
VLEKKGLKNPCAHTRSRWRMWRVCHVTMTLTTSSFNQLCRVVTVNKFSMKHICVLTGAQVLSNHPVFSLSAQCHYTVQRSSVSAGLCSLWLYFTLLERQSVIWTVLSLISIKYKCVFCCFYAWSLLVKLHAHLDNDNFIWFILVAYVMYLCNRKRKWLWMLYACRWRMWVCQKY